jgi:MFS family permease
MLADRFGRKVSMVPGLLLLAAAATLLTVSDTFVLVLFAVSIQGSGEGMTMGTTHTYAMDIAPPEHRGSFLGVVMMLQAVGALLGPMVIGAIYHSVGHAVAFGTLAVWLIIAAATMAAMGRETAGPRAVQETEAITIGNRR